MPLNLRNPAEELLLRLENPAAFSTARSMQRASRRSTPVELSEEDERSLISKAGGLAMSGLERVGNLLDVPGSMVRDLLAGENPLDQLLPWNWTSSEGRTSGRDLLRKYGMAGSKDTLGNFGGGLGAEVLLDPLTYMTFGLSAMGKGGKVAKAAGLMDDLSKVSKVGPRQARMTTTLDELIAGAEKLGRTDARHAAERAAKGMGIDLAEVSGKPLGGLMGLGLPLAEPFMTAGTGPRAQRIAGKMDALGEAIRYSPVGRTAASMLQASSMGRTTKEGQKAAQDLFGRQTSAGQKVRGDILELADTLAQHGLDGAADNMRMRSIGEGVMPLGEDASGVMKSLRGMFDESRQQLERMGVRSTGELDDVIDYMARYSSGGKPRPNSPMAAIDAGDVGRMDALKGFTGGTEALEQVITDDRINTVIEGMKNAGVEPKTIIEAVAARIREMKLMPEIGEIAEHFPARDAKGNYLFEGGRKISPAKIQRGEWDDAKKVWTLTNKKGEVTEALTAKLKNRPEELARWMIDHPDIRKEGLFTNHFLADANRKLTTDAMKVEAADTIHGFLASYAKSPKDVKDGVRVGQLFKELGIDSQKGAMEFAERTGQVLSSDPKDLAQQLKDIRNLHVPAELAADIAGVWPGFKAPESVNAVMKQVDNLTNLFKVGVLTWPARYVRDIVSGQARNIEAGMWDLRSAIDSHNLIRGRTIAGAENIPAVQDWLKARNLPLDAENGTRALRIMYGQYGPGMHNLQTDIAGSEPYERGLSEIMGLIRGRKPTSELDATKDILRTAAGRTADTTLNPLDVRGVGDRTTTKFGPAAAGDKVGRYTDDMNRLVPFLNQLKQGADPAAAMKKIADAQVNYDPRTFTPTERTLKRVFPFYSFATRNLGYTARELMQKPGGRMAQTIRAANRARSSDGLTPDYVAGTTSIPIGGAPEGTDRYLTGFGLMFEDAIDLIGGGGLQGVGGELLSRSNPLVKGPLEWITGESFFQRGPTGGRDLEDMDPTVGRTLANIGQLARNPAAILGGGETEQVDPVRFPGSNILEHVLANSPLSRALTTARTMTDPRKGPLAKATNLATGMRVTDVSPAAKEGMLQENLAEIMKYSGAKKFERISFPKEQLEGLEPAERAELEKLQALMNLLAKRAKERRKAKEESKKD